ncbi:hypothetical protein RRG08_054741 [Elysia crispata]|uniref:Uncharacterized protein n=1 Tax=Elysia crispata TaxID=231223 RepID=A0AAE1B0U4_9GAST|nr:hypothetical protein RRG08_054741 [Elysia crispata]
MREGKKDHIRREEKQGQIPVETSSTCDFRQFPTTVSGVVSLIPWASSLTFRHHSVVCPCWRLRSLDASSEIKSLRTL